MHQFCNRLKASVNLRCRPPPHQPELLQICPSCCCSLIGPLSDWPALWLAESLVLVPSIHAVCFLACGWNLDSRTAAGGDVDTVSRISFYRYSWEEWRKLARNVDNVLISSFFSFPGPVIALPRAVCVRTVIQKYYSLQLSRVWP